MRALVLFSCVLAFLVAACGSSGGSVKATSTRRPSAIATRAPTAIVPKSERPPKLLAKLAEGHLLVGDAAFNLSLRRMYLLNNSTYKLVPPSEPAISPDRAYIAYVLSVGDSATGQRLGMLIVQRAGGEEVIHSQLPKAETSRLFWSATDDQLALTDGKTIYGAALPDAKVRAFDAPPSVWVSTVTWAGTAKLLLSGSGSDNRSHFFLMDALSGAFAEMSLPPSGPHYSPDGSHYTYGTAPEGSGSAGCYYSCDLWLANASGTGAPCSIMRGAYNHGQSVQVPQWSPNSRSFTYMARETQALGTGETRVFDSARCEDILSLEDVLRSVWSPGSKALAIITRSAPDYTDRLALWRVDGSRRSLDLVVTGDPVWSPDGTMVATTTKDGVVLVDAASLSPTVLPLADPAIGDSQSTVLWSPSGRYLLICYLAHAFPNALTPRPGGTRAYVVDRETGSVSTLVDQREEFEVLEWLP